MQKRRKIKEKAIMPVQRVKTLDATFYMYKIYWVLGLLMPKKNKVRYLVYSILVNCAFTFFLPISFTLSYLMLSVDPEFEIGHLLTSLQVAIDVYGCVAKVCAMLILLPKLQTADVVLQHLDSQCHSADEIVEQLKIKRFSARFLLCLVVVYFSYSTSTFLGSVVNSRAPYSLYLPGLNWKRSKWEFYVVSLIEFSMMNTAVVQQVANDFYAVIYVCMLRAHLNILILRIRKISKDTRSQHKNEQQLKLCIKYHKNLIE